MGSLNLSGWPFHDAYKANHYAAAAKSLQSCPTLCNPIDGSPPGSTIPGILQARILEWVAISFSNAWKWKVKVKSLSRVRLSNPMDRSLPDCSVHRILQARVLEWGAIAFSEGEVLGSYIYFISYLKRWRVQILLFSPLYYFYNVFMFVYLFCVQAFI